MEPRLKLYV